MGTEEKEGKAEEEKAKDMKTIWKPGCTLASWAKFLALGILLLPTVILAEPANGLVDPGTAELFPDAISMKALDKSEHTEQLRAYHARLDLITDAYSNDPENDDWKPESIQRYITRTNPKDGCQEVVFKVQWLGGEKSWVKCTTFEPTNLS